MSTDDAQARYESRYDAIYDRDRPRPTHEMHTLRRLAEKAKTDPSAALDFAVACTPQAFLLALAAQRWDDQHPFYSCIHCHDGKDLPPGYVCQRCAAESLRR